MALAVIRGVIQDQFGNAVPNATVEIRLDTPGRPIVPLWGTRNGDLDIPPVPLGNPITTDSVGRFFAHVRGGAYYVRAYTGLSQAPTFQTIERYVAVGTAAENDVESLASMLEAGTATFATLAELELFIPETEGIGGKVTTGEDAGFYHYDMIGAEWVFDRYLYDTVARMNIIGGTANDIEAEPSTGVSPAAVLISFIEPEETNTDAVFINSVELLSFEGNSLVGGQFLAGRTYWYTDEGTNLRLRNEGDVSGLVDIAVSAADTAISEASNAADSAAEAAASAATINTPALAPGDAGKMLFVNPTEDGYDLFVAPFIRHDEEQTLDPVEQQQARVNMLAVGPFDLVTTPPSSGDGLVWVTDHWEPGPAGGGMFKGNLGTTGSRDDDIFRINVAMVSADVTIADGERASATGPLTVLDTFTITVEDGGVLTII